MYQVTFLIAGLTILEAGQTINVFEMTELPLSNCDFADILMVKIITSFSTNVQEGCLFNQLSRFLFHVIISESNIIVGNYRQEGKKED